MVFQQIFFFEKKTLMTCETLPLPLYKILAEVLSVMTWLSSGGCAFFPIMGLLKM